MQRFNDMSICFLCTHYPNPHSGGIEKLMFRFANVLSEYGHNVFMSACICNGLGSKFLFDMIRRKADKAYATIYKV